MPKLMEVLEFLDNSGDTMVKRIPEGDIAEIKWGAQVTVRESQEVVFFRDGKALDILKPGRHVLKTQNIPIIAKWVTSFGYGEDSPFRSEVYFIGKQLFSNLKWGTKEPILFRDSELKMIRIRSFGSFSIQIEDSMLFLNKISGTVGTLTNKNIVDYLRSIILTHITSLYGKEIKTVFDLPNSFEELSLKAKTKLKSEVEGLGLKIHDFYINSISVPEEVQKIIDQRSGMEAVGNIDKFMKYKLALSLENASLNQSSTGDSMGGGIGAGLGLGMGFMMPQILQQSFNTVSNSEKNDSSSSVNKLKKLKELFDLKIISSEEYESRRTKLLDNL